MADFVEEVACGNDFRHLADENYLTVGFSVRPIRLLVRFGRLDFVYLAMQAQVSPDLAASRRVSPGV